MRITTVRVELKQVGVNLTSRKGLKWTPERRRDRARAKKRYLAACKKINPKLHLKYTAIDDYFKERGNIPHEVVKITQSENSCKWCKLLKEGGLNCCLNCGAILDPKISELKR